MGKITRGHPYCELGFRRKSTFGENFSYRQPIPFAAGFSVQIVIPAYVQKIKRKKPLGNKTSF